MSGTYMPPYTMTEEITNLIIEIGEQVGAVVTYDILQPNPKLRRENRIKSIHSSLAIEQNTLLLIHKIMMEGLVKEAGRFRSGNVGVYAGKQLITIAIKEKQLKLRLDNEEDLITLRCHGLGSSQALFDKAGNILINYMDLDTTRKQAILHILVKRI